MLPPLTIVTSYPMLDVMQVKTVYVIPGNADLVNPHIAGIARRFRSG